jgi:hypothetical protein
MAGWVPAGDTELVKRKPTAATRTTGAEPLEPPPLPKAYPTKRRLSGLWGWLRGFLFVYLGVEALAFLTDWGEIAVIGRAMASGHVSLEEMEAATAQMDFYDANIGLAGLATFIVCVVLWCRLTYRAMSNLDNVHNPVMAMSPGWAVGWWFIPLAWLWKPLEGVRQIWRGSRSPWYPGSVDVPAQIGWWWALWIFASILGNVSFDRSLINDANLLRAPYVLDMVSAALEVPLVLLAMWFWSRIAAMQDGRYPGAAAKAPSQSKSLSPVPQ